MRAKALVMAAPAAVLVAVMLPVRTIARDGVSISAIRIVRQAVRIAAGGLLASQTVNSLAQTAVKETAIRIVERNAQITATEVVAGVPEAVLADAHHALDSCGNKKGAAK